MVLLNDNDDSRQMIEQCYQKNKTSINPIIDWSDSDVWSFIKDRQLPYCSLYDEGLERLGCIGCPMARKKGREKEFLRWPKYKASYMRAFEKIVEARKANGLKPLVNRDTAEDLFNWWMEYDVLPGQIDMFGEEYETETYD